MKKEVIETRCPDEELFVRLQQGDLPDRERAALMQHIDACPSCSELLFMLTELEQPAEQLHSEELLPKPKKPLMIGRYEVIEQAGVGGLGVVYKTRDTRLDRLVAVKLLRPDVLATRPEHSNEATQRLQREARVLARLDHPHIVAIYDMDRHEDQFFTACAFIDGGNLRDWSRASARGWREVVSLSLQVARALGAAHEVGIVHRDVKPENVLLREGVDHALLTDFGMATLPLKTSTTRFATDDLATQQGMILGTPAYMSPEQLDGQSATAASDQFSFCVMLYEALYGFRPYHATDYQELLQVLKRGELVKPSSSTIPDAVFDVLAQGLRPMPGERHPDMDTLTSKLEAILSPTQLESPPTFRWAPVAIAAITLTIGSIAVLINLSQGGGGDRVREEASRGPAREQVAQQEKGGGGEEPPLSSPPTAGGVGEPTQQEPPEAAREDALIEPTAVALDEPRPKPVEVASLTTPKTPPPVQPGPRRAAPRTKNTPPPTTTAPPSPSPGPPAGIPPELAKRVQDTFEDRRDFSYAVLRYDGKACKKHYDNVVAVFPDWEFTEPDNIFRLRCEYLRGDCKLASEFERLLPNQLVPMDATQIARHNLMYAHPSCLKSTSDKLLAATHHALDACVNPMRKKECDTRMQRAKELLEAHPDDPVITNRKVSDSVNWVMLELAKREKEAKKEGEEAHKKTDSP